MGRTPTKNKNLPRGMRLRHRKYGSYYYLDTGANPRREIPLGSDYVLAVQKWAELTASEAAPGSIVTFRHVAERYQREVLPGKAAATQEGNLRELASLYRFFDNPPVALDDIDPVDVRQYIDWRVTTTVAAKVKENAERAKEGRPALPIPKDAGSVRANREKALLSHIWNFARETGLTAKANPCAGVKGKSEKGRDAYIDDAVFKAVWDAAEMPLRDAMDLAYLTGQRPADVLKLSQADIKDGALTVVQNKTGKRLRIAIEGELAAVIERIKQRKVMGLGLVNTMSGERMGKASLRGAFDRARDAAKIAHPEMEKAISAFQFRDLRAKAGTDKEESGGMEAAQAQLGHSTPTMTAHYVRHRKGKLVKPTK
jgi:integrase